MDERICFLNSLRAVDGVRVYQTEEHLLNLLKSGEFNLRFLGDDYEGQEYNFKDLDLPVHFLNRAHGWSNTKLRNRIEKQCMT